MQEILSQAATELTQLLQRVSEHGHALESVCSAMFTAWSNGKKVLICGNGGSAADAMHFAEELVVRYRENRRALAAIALCDPTIITCAGNDFGYATVFERQVEALGNTGDLLIVMSTSGNSENLVRAASLAKQRGLQVITFIGKDGGQLRGLGNIELLVKSNTTARIQEMHKLFFHVICEWIDRNISVLQA